MKKPNAPEERGETVRQTLAAALRERPLTARELSAVAGIPEREVAAHVEHLGRSLAAHGERLLVEPAYCKSCGFRFEERSRASRPSRCPSCKSERLGAARFAIAGVSRADD